ncbi:MAG TPA: hypothetical protein HPP66_11675 [Planctomycetes bacterium]|nr:hypothetical protein [Planctomycetota bacterium]
MYIKHLKEMESEACEVSRLTSSKSRGIVNLLQRALSIYAFGMSLGHAPDNTDATLARMGLISQNFNSLKAAVDLACRGYYLQTMGLLRNVYENWLAFWYLSKYPAEAERWLHASWDSQPPKAETMKNKINHPSKSMKAKLGELNAELCRFAHTDPVAILPLLSACEGETTVHFGVTYNARLFSGCAYGISLWMGNMLDVLALWIPEGSDWHKQKVRLMDELLAFIEGCNEELSGQEDVDNSDG